MSLGGEPNLQNWLCIDDGELHFVLTSIMRQLQRSREDSRTLWESFKLISVYPKYTASEASENRDECYQNKEGVQCIRRHAALRPLAPTQR